MDKKHGEKRKLNYINVCARQWFMIRYIKIHEEGEDLVSEPVTRQTIILFFISILYC